MRNKIGILVAVGVGVAGGKYLFEAPLLEQKAKQDAERSAAMSSQESAPESQPAPLPTKRTTPPLLSQSASPLVSAPTPTFFTPANPASLTPSAIANTRTLAHLPSTEISKSAHPDDAAKIMDEPLPSSPLIAKKIPNKEDCGEMQAEPYTKAPGGLGMFDKVKFW